MAKVYSYVVSYRISEQKSAKGTYNQRRDGLIAGIEELDPNAENFHFTTSSFVIRCLLEKAEEVADTIQEPLDLNIDELMVIQVNRNNSVIR